MTYKKYKTKERPNNCAKTHMYYALNVPKGHCPNFLNFFQYRIGFLNWYLKVPSGMKGLNKSPGISSFKKG